MSCQPLRKEAKEWFARLHDEQRGQHDEGRTKLVAWRGFKKLRRRDGVENRQGVSGHSEASEANYEIKNEGFR